MEIKERVTKEHINSYTVMEMRNAVVLEMLLLVMAFHAAQGAEYIVGDSTGWQNPPNPTFYSSWASSHNFAVGDILTFNFQTGVHSVATINQDAYNNCNTANPITSVTNGPANVTLSNTGMHYYTCTFSGHCSAGQKLAINVTSSTPSPPGTTATSPFSPPPSPSSASSIVANFAFIVMSIAMVFMFC